MELKNGYYIAKQDYSISFDTFDINIPMIYSERDMMRSSYISNLKYPYTKGEYLPIIQKRWSDLSITLDTITVDSLTCRTSAVSHATFLKPYTVYLYPYNPLLRKAFLITLPLSYTDIMKSLIWQFIGCSLLSLLLFICLVYQLRIILWQRKTDELRGEFVHTMIHELKRPVQTLKMCVSLLRNKEKREDASRLDDIVHVSSEELDNLSSYLTKLREIIRIEENIPLDLECLDLHELLISQSDKAQSLNKGREININIDYPDDIVKNIIRIECTFRVL